MSRSHSLSVALGSFLLVSLYLGAIGCSGEKASLAEKKPASETAAHTEAKTAPPATQQAAETAAPATETPRTETTPVNESKPAQSENEIAVMETTMGTIKLKFFADAAPKAVENFKSLAKKGYYNGITFHRVIDKFMIQGGDPTGTGRNGQSIWGKPFEDEFSPKIRFDRKGLFAMANAGPATNGSQFFITLVPTPHLNDRHTIFGEVVEGMDIVDKIGKVAVGAGDKPTSPVTMTKVSIVVPAAKAAGE